MEAIYTQYKGLTCHNCGTVFDDVNTGGAPGICLACVDLLLGIIHGGRVTGRDAHGNVIVDTRRRVRVSEVERIF